MVRKVLALEEIGGGCLELTPVSVCGEPKSLAKKTLTAVWRTACRWSPHKKERARAEASADESQSLDA